MLDGDRSDRRSSWLTWIAGSILILLAATGAIYGVSQQARYEQAAVDHADEYARHAHEKAEKPCRLLTGSEQAKCAANADREEQDQSRDKRREYDDLVAQQTSALWTGIMGLAAITGMILSVVGVGLVYATFRETRRTANEAARSADAFIATERGWLKMGVEVGHRKKDTDVMPMSFRGILRGRAGIEIQSIQYAQLSSTTFPQECDWQLIAPRHRAHQPDPDAGWFSLGHEDIPFGPGYIGGWASYQTQFPGVRRAYFLFELFVGSHYVNGTVGYAAKRVDGLGWPDDT